MSTSISLFCIVHREQDATPFPVRVNREDTIGELKELIKEQCRPEMDHIASRHLKLWKWNKSVRKVTDADLNTTNSLDPMDTVDDVFENDSPQRKVIHIIIKAPLPAFSPGIPAPSADTPNWTDYKSILSWVEQYRRPVGTEPSKLISSFGSTFPFLHRQETIDTLWNGTQGGHGVLNRFKQRHVRDQTQHPIPFLACGPGTGKSRFLLEAVNVLCEKALSQDDEDVRKAFENVLAVNVTYGNGTSTTDDDVRLGGEVSVGTRLLYEYFIGTDHTLTKATLGDIQSTQDVSKLKLETVIKVICSDFKSRSTENHNPESRNPVLILGVDEVSALHSVSPDTLRNLIYAIGRINCSSSQAFCIPILAGTIQGPIEKMVSISRYRLLQLPLPLLTEDDMLQIGRSLRLQHNNRVIRLTERYLQDNTLFRRSITDIGGMARALESFYDLVIDRVKMMGEIPEDDKSLTALLDSLDIVMVMQDLASYLRYEYRGFQDYVDLAMPILAAAVLDMPVCVDEEIEVHGTKMTYKDLGMTGIISLQLDSEADQFHVRIPYLWLMLLANACSIKSVHSPWKYWTNYIDHTRVISWGGWEEFNMKYLALRVCLFSFLGRKSITLEELFPGADFSPDFPDFEIEIPHYDKIEEVEVCQLLLKYPENEDSNDIKGSFHKNHSEKYYKFFVNGSSALVDGFVQFSTPEGRPFMLCLQMKFSNEHNSNNPVTIDTKTVKEESEKFSIVNDTLKKKRSDLECAFGIFSNRSKIDKLELMGQVKYMTKGKAIKTHIDIFLIHKGNFEKYYGSSFSGRAQFSVTSQLYINTAPEHHIKHIPKLKPKDFKKILEERKRKRFQNNDDLISRVPKFPCRELSSIKY